MSARAWRLLYALIAATYAGLRLAAYLPSSIRVFPDSGTYVNAAARPLLSVDFLAGPRAWTVPLLYKLLPDSDSARAAGQLIVSIGCWLALAAAVAWCVRRRGLQPIAFCLVLLFSLSVWITQWDRAILSESVAVSLTAAVLAAWLLLVRAPSRWTIAAVLFTTLLWGFARDTDATMAFMAVPFVLGWVALGGPRRGRVVLAAGLVAIFAANVVSQAGPNAAPGRWEMPMLNVIGERVLTNSDELRYFRAHGMPLPGSVRALAGTQLGIDHLRGDLPLGRDPRLDGFRRWVREHGRQTLARYLVVHPSRTLQTVVDGAGPLLATEPAGYHGEGKAPIATYRAPGTHPLLPAPVAAVVYPPSVAAVLIWLAVVLAAAGWLAWRGRARPVWLVPAVAVLMQLPHAAIVWNGDAAGVARHALLVSVMTRLGLLMLSIFLLDAALDRRGEPS